VAVSHEQSKVLPDKPTWSRRLDIPEMWPSIAISVMWLAVLFDAVYGPDFVSTTATSMTRIPSAIILALFAWLATRTIAKCAFGGDRDRSDVP
jgi:hypothetical protein